MDIINKAYLSEPGRNPPEETEFPISIFRTKNINKIYKWNGTHENFSQVHRKVRGLSLKQHNLTFLLASFPTAVSNCLYSSHELSDLPTLSFHCSVRVGLFSAHSDHIFEKMWTY